MSEKYVKDILEKLEEIEKLHTKLRTLVPRVKNYDSENTVSIPAEELSKRFNKVGMKEDNKNLPKQTPVDIHRSFETLKNVYKSSKTNIKNFVTPPEQDSKYFKGGKWRRLRSNSVDFVKKQWQEKGDKFKNFLSNIVERDIILGKTI
ncbi:uncharacterized protein LOC114879520 [Osmia bicornis bicornis]|uniref:uncharacterized protein LOC114879520 n=1 Tax=Osmia bicornis bicornis TaxID=1437191 RepID=UPI001EAED402|nr:uncharacterized protein LOC114879520 [Osmia bicornis bicornis]